MSNHTSRLFFLIIFALFHSPIVWGMTWSVAVPPTLGAAPLNGITYGNGSFVAVGPDGILASTDGLSWHHVASGPGLRDVTWTGTEFVAIGTNAYMTSLDGTSWKSYSALSLLDVASVSWDGTLFVAVDGIGHIHLGVPTFGVLWVQADFDARAALNGVVATPGLYVAVGSNGTIVSSTDAASWTSRSSGTSAFLTAVCFGNGRLVAVGESGTILISDDAGVSWSTPDLSNIDATDFLYSVAWNGHIFVAGGYRRGDGEASIFASTDGYTWNRQSTPSTSEVVNDIVWSGFRFVSVGSGGNILFSNDSMPVKLQAFDVE